MHLWSEVSPRLLSFDTAAHPVLGNLASGPNLERFLHLPRCGAIAGCLTGSPCETWSAARHLQLKECVGPRPLRSAELPWRFPTCTGKELLQASMGSDFQVEIEVVSKGGGSLMGHPKEHSQEDRASVWRTAAHLRWPMTLPGAHRHMIDQYRFDSGRQTNLPPSFELGRSCSHPTDSPGGYGFAASETHYEVDGHE